ncbi:serine hydrolase [Mycobacterium sp. NBC_00419]|uniref:serine hydrolase n=1 Tax=Mycobacterium sp. NBC_00419 TaxID=2975989 RepID=UPI002E1CD7F0
MTALARRAALVVLLVALTACSSNPTKPEASKVPSDVPPPLVPAMALPDNAVDNAVAKLDGIAADLLKSSGIPGLAVAVVHGGKTIYAKGFGVKDATRPADDPANKVDPDTVFQLASVSKSIGSTVVAHQVGKKVITWDTPVVDKLPWFALSDPAVTKMVAVSDLYSHRSGLPDHAGDKLEDLGYDRRYVLERLRDYPLDPFRISYAYTNFGLTAAAEAVAVASGKSWEDLSDEVLYRPLGMASTSSRFADFEARGDKALGHIRIDGSYAPRYKRDADPEAPAGGVSSSVNDLTHWLAMMLGNGTYNGQQIVAPEALLPAVTPQIVSSPPSEPAMRSGFYGYGFNVGTTSAARTQISHSGAFELGTGTNFVIIPSADVAIVALTNATPTGVAETLTAEFADLVQFGEVREDWRKLYGDAFAEMDKPVGSLSGKQPPANPAPAKPLAGYAGSYANSFWGPAVVAEKDGKLTISLGPKPQTYELKHWDGDVFALSFVDENSPPGSVSAARFDGDKLTLEYYDDEKMGTWVR